MTAGDNASAPRSSPSRAAIALTIAVGAVVMSVAMGIRQGFGLFLAPLALDRGLPVSQIALAIALHNLVWGMTQPLAGAAADRYGTVVVVLIGGVIYALGLVLSALLPHSVALMAGLGVFVGVGLSCCTFGTILAAVGHAAPPARRTTLMGVTSALGSVGAALAVPLAQVSIDTNGPSAGLLVLGVGMLVVTPLGVLFRPVDRLAAATLRTGEPVLGFGAALREAAGHRGYVLLTLGFFTCGFQLAFFHTHLPGYVAICHLPPALGATALAVFGVFNAGGSWFCGYLGSRFRPQYVLAWIYVVRTVAIAGLLILPKTHLTILAFSAIVGFIALGTVPLTSGLIARIFGVENLGMLFGVCFLNHQVGAFLGAWAGAFVFDLTGSYDAVWILTAVAGVVAAVLYLPIRDQAVARLRLA